MTPGTSKEVSGNDLVQLLQRLSDAVQKLTAFKDISALGLDANIIVSPTPDDAKIQSKAEDLMKGLPYKILKGDPDKLDEFVDRYNRTEVATVIERAILTHVIGKL